MSIIKYILNESVGKSFYSKILFPTYSGSLDASFVARANTEIKIGAKTRYDESGSNNGDAIKRDAYKKSVAVGVIVYKCGSITYKTSSHVSQKNFDLTYEGVRFTNLTKTSSAFCNKGDSGGIV